ncbi:MAG: response regulator [Nitrospinae bacterium]|nr:response regulator [Nitrospinota bacterium]
MSGLKHMASRMPLKWQMTSIILLTSFAASLFIIVAYVVFDITYFINYLEREMAVDTTVAASQSESAIMFNDQRAAEDILKAFSHNKHIRSIVIFTPSGGRFASYVSPEAAAAPPGAAGLRDGFSMGWSKASYTRQITTGRERVGWIVMEANLTGLFERLQWQALVFAVTMIVLAPAAFLLSIKLQRLVSEPVLRLASLARQISAGQSYPERAQQAGENEIGDLVNAFNEMLGQIQSRDRMLMERAEALEAQVASRTGELAVSNSKLKSELEERISIQEALLSAKEQAEQATKIKDKFVSLVAHDLKSPLTSINGLLSLAYSDIAGMEAGSGKLIARALTIGQQMANMVDELLDLSRLQSGMIKPELKFTESRNVILDAVMKVQFIVESKGIKIVNRVEEGKRIYTDPYLFGEVIVNLLSNAAKFSHPGGEISIFTPPDMDTTIAVSDNGIGIPPKILAAIFDHGEYTSRKGTAGEMGTGLGLPLSQDIMKAMGGSLRAESEDGKGAVFFATLPFVRPKALIVDDDREMRLLLTRLLSKFDVEIAQAANGREAIWALENGGAHLVISDMYMPEMDGLRLLEYVRKHPKLNSLAFIVITSSDGKDVKEKAFATGADDFISRPFNMDEFFPRIARFLHALPHGKR